MSRLFPFRPPVSEDREDALVCSLTGEEADAVFDALAARTTREILDALYDDPAPASELAEATDTSLQNARYHLDKLLDAGLIAVADTWYSDRGVEMRVYAPTREAVVLVGGDTDGENKGGGERALLKRLLGVVGVVGGGALALAAALNALDSGSGGSGASGGAGAGTTAAPTTAASGTTSGASGGSAGSGTANATAANVTTTAHNATAVHDVAATAAHAAVAHSGGAFPAVGHHGVAALLTALCLAVALPAVVGR